MHLTCRDCGAVIPAEDINIDRAIAKCRACNAVINVEAELRGPDGASPPRKRPRVPQPTQVIVENLGNGLRLTRRWSVASAVFFTFFYVLFGLIAFLFMMAVRTGELQARNGVPWWVVFLDGVPWWVVFLVTIPVGVWLSYVNLAMYLNRTVIKVSQGRLTVRHGPLPWPGRRDLDTCDLEQLFCQEKTLPIFGGTVYHTVGGVLKGGRQVTLLSPIGLFRQVMGRNEALFVEQVIEKYLGIEDRPVGGELPRH
jgi:hypothetical protein